PDAGADDTHAESRTSGTAALDSGTPDHVGPPTLGHTPGRLLSADARRHLASLLVYAALAARQRGAPLEARDDDPNSDTDLIGPITDTHRAIQLRHTRTRDHRRTTGPHPDTPTPEHLIQHTPETILAAEHWTDPFTGRNTPSTGKSTPSDDTDQAWRDEPPPF
ncbi:hypothetical protein ACI3EY_11810, partial [Ornithinimicrobium sp. LYQ92]|uniref:hypothetical protein n=1 Tax=Serinicoccus sp. LYQ92 TaxID=3378798 RepID=UPI003852C2FD